ncbi:recombinase family protein [Dyella sp.]|uniref:recombinase family protein n=1 Tax=Dyella sp. TaxID=1869338 RepID=UPI00284BAC27|nr:recombinase family protein [Dyella sp.]MDR3445404.1 recombinase family protein [Dyella sp.]
MVIFDASDDLKDEAGGAIPVAQYVRMSTDHQRYSTANQEAAIAEYASLHGMSIIQTYGDEGKSGLALEGRDSLRRLLKDVESGQARFKAILVYDVSRWGRFQNSDESAHYEYLCTQAGIRVIYVAEPFENDGTPLTTIIKSVKRSMAAEYSRELSTKVFAGQCRLVKLGFHQGGSPGFGLRRCLIDDQRRVKAELTRGEHKSIQTDRVVLVPGPSEEVFIVQRIYRDFIERGLSERDIADALNRSGILTDLGRLWTRGTVHQVLTNEKYIGNNVYNRTSGKLKTPLVRNLPERWVRCEGAFQGVISIEFFKRAREIILARSHRFDDAQMLKMLEELLGRLGTVSGIVIDEQEGMPSSSAYQARFGGLLRAYELIGYRPGRDFRYIEVNRHLRAWRPSVVDKVVATLQRMGGSVSKNPASGLFLINEEWTLCIVLARCEQSPSGTRRWTIRFDEELKPDITVAVRMDSTNQDAHDYYVIPRLDTALWPRKLHEDNQGLIDSYRFDSLEILSELAAREKWEMAL